MSDIMLIDWKRRGQPQTQRELQRREIANQVEEFLRHGGRIDVLNSALRDAGAPIGRVWSEGGRLE